jgi:hypothetical protein
VVLVGILCFSSPYAQAYGPIGQGRNGVIGIYSGVPTSRDIGYTTYALVFQHGLNNDLDVYCSGGLASVYATLFDHIKSLGGTVSSSGNIYQGGFRYEVLKEGKNTPGFTAYLDYRKVIFNTTANWPGLGSVTILNDLDNYSLMTSLEKHYGRIRPQMYLGLVHLRVSNSSSNPGITVENPAPYIGVILALTLEYLLSPNSSIEGNIGYAFNSKPSSSGHGDVFFDPFGGSGAANGNWMYSVSTAYRF